MKIAVKMKRIFGRGLSGNGGFLYNNGIYGFYGYIWFLRHLASNALNIA